MTNEALVRIFFMGIATGKEESYGLSIKPEAFKFFVAKDRSITRKESDLALFSKTSQFPLARKLSENYFMISTLGSVNPGSNWKNHLSLATIIAKQIGVGLLASPSADETNFQKYMERKINDDLAKLARASSTAQILQPVLIFTELYQNLMKNIRTLLEGETLLKLPKHQVILLDTDKAQVLWAWLIKENPEKEDRELLREIYILSRLLAPIKNRRIEIDRIYEQHATSCQDRGCPVVTARQIR